MVKKQSKEEIDHGRKKTKKFPNRRNSKYPFKRENYLSSKD